MKSNKKNIIFTILLFVLFGVFTALVMTVDVGVGRENTPLGFSTFNKLSAEVFTFNMLWYELTEILGYVAIGVCLGFGLFGLVQLIKRKSLKAVDREIWVLAGFYIVVIAFYALFEKFEVNYRPVMLAETLEASYPSSHTVLALCVFMSAVILFEKYLDKKKNLKAVMQALFILFGVFTVVGRMLSGVHWITDIFGGCFLSAALLMGFVTVLRFKEQQ